MTRVLTTELRRADPRSDPDWQRLAEARGADLFHSPAWLRALHAGYGLEPTAWIVPDADGAPRSGLVACALDDLLGRRAISLPFSDYCDPLLGDPGDWAPLAEAWLATDAPARLRCLHAAEPVADERFEATGWAYWHAVDLLADEDAQWSALHSTARRNVARARRAGVRVEASNRREDLRAFFELHLALRKTKYRLLAQPYAFFEALWEEFLAPGHGTLLVARRGEELVAGILLLEAYGKLYYKFNASSPAHLEARPNDLLAWSALRHGAERGLAHLDFGVSDHDQPGLVRYKRKFASLEARVTTLQHGHADPADRRAREIRELLGALTSTLTAPDVPDAVAERVGARLYGYFA